MIALLEQLLHLTAKIFLVVLKLFIVEADVCVACHSQNTAFLHRVSIKQRRQPAQEDILRTHKALPIRKQQIRRRTVRYRHNADGLVSFFAFQQRGGIEFFVDQMRNGMVWSDHNRRQNRQQLCFEKAVDLLQIVGTQCLGQNILHAAARKLVHDGSVNLFFHGKQPWNDAVNMVQLLRRRPAGLVVSVIRRHAGKVKETAYTHHEEFIEIA